MLLEVRTRLRAHFFRISTKKGLILILVYVDDLLVASQDQKEGEDFLAKLMAIWRSQDVLVDRPKVPLSFCVDQFIEPKMVNQLCTSVPVDSIW